MKCRVSTILFLLFAESSAMDDRGAGLGALATKDDAGLVVEIWNLKPESGNTDVRVVVKNLPANLRSSSLRIRRYQIDSRHSNCFSEAGAPGGLEMTEETTLPASEDLRFEVAMEPMGLCLWLIEVADGK